MKGTTTLTLIKPRAVSFGFTGPILHMIVDAGFNIVALKMLHLNLEQAGQFYDVHRNRSFFHDLVEFMSSSPIVAAILQKENAVDDFRKLIGATDPQKAAEGTVRKLYGHDVQQNAVHGSDSDENAIRESNFFFSQTERFYSGYEKNHFAE